ncbi:MAG: redoxin family protein [Ginsengibacter sp.]
MKKKIFFIALILLQGFVVLSQVYIPLESRAFSVDSIASFSLANVGGSAEHIDASSKSILVITFLSPECPVCKNYSGKLVEYKKKYADEVSFVGIIPGSFEANDVKEFQKTYMPSWTLLRDTALQLTHYLHGEVTPEVLVIDNKDGVLIYKGAIDDWMVALGKTRNHISNHYLDMAINNFINNKPAIPFTKPVGCLINDF